MCPKGNVCGNCGAPATMELHYPAFVEKFCDICAPKYASRVMYFYDLKEEPNEKPRVN